MAIYINNFTEIAHTTRRLAYTSL